MNVSPEVQKQVKVILGPILALLRSRKFMAAVIGLFVMWLVAQAPSLAPYTAELILAISVIISVIVGGIAHEDAAAQKAAAIEAAGRTQQENIQAAIEAGVAAFYDKQAALEAQAAPVEVDVGSLTRNVAALVTAQLVEQSRAAGDPAAG